ncbi:hypothetical protein PYCC9005_004398 [Savitreella phatthalungensis]
MQAERSGGSADGAPTELGELDQKSTIGTAAQPVKSAAPSGKVSPSATEGRPDSLRRASSTVTTVSQSESASSPAKDANTPTAGVAGRWKGWLSSARTPSFRLEMPFTRNPPVSQVNSGRTVQNVGLAQQFADVRQREQAHRQDINWDHWQAAFDSHEPGAMEMIRQHMQSTLPDILRGMVWQAILESKNEDLAEVYTHLASASAAQAGEYDKQIAKDVRRVNKSLIRRLEGK